jgi:hypothetical protein
VGLRKILKCYPEILDKITSLETFSSTLGEHMKGISKILVPIMERVRREQLSEHRAKKLILRIVPTLASSGYEHLLNAISSCSDESREYIKNIYSNFDNEYEYLKYLESRQTGF